MSDTTDQRLIHFNLDVSDDTILAAVRKWSDILAEEDYETALALVSPRYWTPDLLRRVIRSYDDPEAADQTHKVTPLATARYWPGTEPVNVPWPRHCVDRMVGEDGETYISIWFDLPLDGCWSDLTATFYLNRIGDKFVLELETVHIM